ncbi:ubiquitin carboxyl-terminal hydrolase 18-like [Phalaenopsis equestris]|uniref:ubiquitin carboxyl-terminal hydrolase 18-like n=1 Tax=Phalaenopsis equestris TaxID=78828 RepID=UPI0009E62A56|nr:ubiquitin carboxyl-terminal hydrolase 18-like [Phalaenopsis equestris]
MLGAVLTALDLSALYHLAWTCLVVIIAGVLFVRKAVTWPFALNADIEGNEEFRDRYHMPIGSVGSNVGAGASECPVCARPASKKCSRCKSVWYCSQVCQSDHWKAEHKSKCREVGSADKFDTIGTGARRKCSAISLVPGHGTRKVLKEPKKILFPYDEFVKLFVWDMPAFPPRGLLNCGNSCFANVVLQCLTSTRPLVAYLLEKDHNRGCLRRRDNWCFLCELQVHIKRASESSQAFSPINILSRLPNIGGNLGYGRQEDAHEFMRFAIDTMQSICLDEYGGEKAVDPSTQETTIVQYIFGGHLRSQVICTNCDVVSNRYENMMDLTVEIHGDSESLEECLDQFTVKEWLDGDNMYKCDGCNAYVKAWKRLTVHQAPNVLTITLKRFQSGRFGKLNKRITFPENLDLTPYMSASGDDTDHYTLYGVIVHLDMLNASFFGHYICYTKDYRGIWYKIDDCKVIKVEVEEVLSQAAYMLLYHRINPRKDPFVKPVEPTTKMHSAETDLEISKSPDTTQSSACDIISMPHDSEPQQNILHSEAPSEFSTLRDNGHDRHLNLIPNCAGNFAWNFSVDNSVVDPSGANDIKLENANVFENGPSIKSIPSKASNLANSNLHMEEGNESVIIEAISDPSSTGKDIIMEEASATSISTSSPDKAPTSSFCSHPEPPAINCVSSIPTNGICTSDTSVERERFVSMDGSRPKTKPIFNRGFLDKPVRKKTSGGEKTVQLENHVVSWPSKANGYSNGHLKSEPDIVMPNGSVSGDALSSDSNLTSISTGSSNGRPHDHAEVKCNGSFYNEEFGLERSCSSSETFAKVCDSMTEGHGFGFQMDEA